MRYIEGEDRNKIKIFSPTIEEMISEENIVRVIEEFVNIIDMKKAGFTKVEPKETGALGYNPKDMLKLYIYGYMNKIRSSRLLMKETGKNIELMWLMKNLRPDFRTIADFRKENKKAIKNVFKQFVDIGIKMELYGKEIVAIDGTKIKASNAKGKNYTVNTVKNLLKRLYKQIDEYVEMLETGDSGEEETKEIKKEEIKKVIKRLEEKKEEYNEKLEEMKKENVSQISLTDPESRRMLNNGKYEICYNVQSIVDEKNHMIADYEITDKVNDLEQLSQMSKLAKETLNTEELEVIADAGYNSKKEIIETLMNGIYPTINTRIKDENKIVLEIEYKHHEITEKMKKSRKKEDIQKCLESGIIPEIFKKYNIQITVEKITNKEANKKEELIYETVEIEGRRDYFERDLEKDIVICPIGRIMPRKSTKNEKVRYGRVYVCKDCPEKCTQSKFKIVEFAPNKKIVKLIKKIDLKKPKKEANKIVKIMLIPEKKKLKKRKSIVEHPFGTIKRHMDGTYFLLKGKEKAAAETALFFLIYNLKRATKILGTKGIIEKMRAIFLFFLIKTKKIEKYA